MNAVGPPQQSDRRRLPALGTIGLALTTLIGASGCAATHRNPAPAVVTVVVQDNHIGPGATLDVTGLSSMPGVRACQSWVLNPESQGGWDLTVHLLVDHTRSSAVREAIAALPEPIAITETDADRFAAPPASQTTELLRVRC